MNVFVLFFILFRLVIPVIFSILVLILVTLESWLIFDVTKDNKLLHFMDRLFDHVGLDIKIGVGATTIATENRFMIAFIIFVCSKVKSGQGI